MTTKKIKTYSYDEYLKTFYPHQIERKDILFDPNLFGDKLAEKSLKKLRESFKPKPTSHNKSAKP